MLAIEFLHDNKIMHRGIKPENILLDSDKKKIYLTDFEHAIKNSHARRAIPRGTYQFMAPEMVKQQPHDYKVDCWALGAVALELAAGML